MAACYDWVIKGGERNASKIGDLVVIDPDGDCHSVPKNELNLNGFVGSAEMRIGKCLNVIDTSDTEFIFDSEMGKRFCTEILLFVLSVISERQTITKILDLDFYRDSSDLSVAETVFGTDDVSVVRIRFNLATMMDLKYFRYL